MKVITPVDMAQLAGAKAAARANGILGQLSRAVTYRDRDTFLKLYKVYVRPHLEYAVVSW